MFLTNVNVALLRPVVAMKMILRCLKFDALASRSDIMVSFLGRFKKHGKRECVSHVSKISYGIETSQCLVSEHCFIDFDTFYSHVLIFVVRNTETLKQKLWKEQCQRE